MYRPLNHICLGEDNGLGYKTLYGKIKQSKEVFYIIIHQVCTEHSMVQHQITDNVPYNLYQINFIIQTIDMGSVKKKKTFSAL